MQPLKILIILGTDGSSQCWKIEAVIHDPIPARIAASGQDSRGNPGLRRKRGEIGRKLHPLLDGTMHKGHRLPGYHVRTQSVHDDQKYFVGHSKYPLGRPAHRRTGLDSLQFKLLRTMAGHKMIVHPLQFP